MNATDWGAIEPPDIEDWFDRDDDPDDWFDEDWQQAERDERLP